MKRRYLLIIVIAIILIFPYFMRYWGYKKQVDSFNNNYSQIVDLIDPDNLRESILEQDLPSKLYHLEEILVQVAEAPINGNLSDIMLLKLRYETLREVIEVGQKQESPHGIERLSLENKLELLKNENKQKG
ncbi:MAG TPA: hypothetical protein PLA73_09785 [Sedimentibacter sp.]|nr:hypothetical protein [Sedimentibacter sp.]